MSRQEKPGDGQDHGASQGSEPVAESLRAAVERTLAATAGSASEAGQRARELLDDVARRGEAAREEVGRRGGEARDEVERRGQVARDRIVRGRTEATEELARRGEAVGARLADAISEFRGSDADTGPIREGLAAIEGRLSELERALRGTEGAGSGSEGQSNPRPKAEESPGRADTRADSGPEDSV